uniref:F-box domain-containing protein n=1 Tax=Panagrellus redivivus TaxID=6233 RepID=A0A7E4UV03_PANRE
MFNLSMKPFSKLRKRSNTFRHKLCHRASVITSHFNASAVPVPAKPLHPEPAFTVDHFLERLMESKSSIDSGISSKDSHSTISEGSLTLETIPTQCFKQILSYIPAEEIPALRTVSKYFDQTIQREHASLQKIEVDALHVARAPDNGDVVRVGAQGIKCEMSLRNVNRPLRMVHAQQVSLYRLTIESKDIQYLHRAFPYHVVEMRFIECYFKINSNDLAIMVNHWKLESVEFHNCQWTDYAISEFHKNYIVEDRFFTMNSQLDFICFDFSLIDEKELGFTDKLGCFFTRPILPSSLIFNNCRTCITVKTLFAAVSAYLESLPSRHTHFYMWSFGKIVESRDNILAAFARLSAKPTVQTVSPNGRLEFTFHAGAGCPPLHLVVDLDEPEDDIDYDDEDYTDLYSQGTLDLSTGTVKAAKRLQ